MIYLIINLIFPTSFQFINLSNLALWLNNKRRWITVIFLNLCDNLLYYIIYFFLLSLVFVFLFLFISLSLSCRLISDPHPYPLPTLWIYYVLLAKKFPNFTIFFLSLHLSLLLPNYRSINNQIYSLSLSHLYNIRESHKHRLTESHKAKKPKKKNTTGTDYSQSPTSVHHYQ